MPLSSTIVVCEMLVGLVALLAVSTEARLAWVPAAPRPRVRVPPGQFARRATRYAGPLLKDEGNQTGDAEDRLSGVFNFMKKFEDKLERYSDTMWSPPWNLDGQIAAKGELESAVRDAEIEVESARKELADACARAEEYQAQKTVTAVQLARTEGELENTKAELEEACRTARDQVSSLGDALEDAQNKLAKVQQALDEAAVKGAKGKQMLAKTRAEFEEQRKSFVKDLGELRDKNAANCMERDD